MPAQRTRRRAQSDNHSIAEASELLHAHRARAQGDHESHSSTATTMNSPNYTTVVLTMENCVISLFEKNFNDYPSFEQRFRDIHSKTTESLVGNGSDDDASIIRKAHDLAEALQSLEESEEPVTEQEWVSEMQHIWQFYNMKEHFSVGHNQLWTYDAAIRNLIPGRKDLKQPKPDYAFGLKYDISRPGDRNLKKAAVNVKNFTDPAINIVCAGHLIMPFLVGEAKTPDGSLLVAKRQMCNALVKAHDNLGALNLSDQLVIYSFVHHGQHMQLFSSISVLETNERGLTFVKQIFVIKVAQFVMDELGALKFLRFIKFVKTYAMGVFTEAVNEALQTFTKTVQQAGLILM